MEKIAEEMHAEEALKEVAEPVQNFFSSIANTYHMVKLAVQGLYGLVATANIVMSVNKYVLMGLSFYAAYHLLYKYAWRPLRNILQFGKIRFRTLDYLH